MQCFFRSIWKYSSIKIMGEKCRKIFRKLILVGTFCFHLFIPFKQKHNIYHSKSCVKLSAYVMCVSLNVNIKILEILFLIMYYKCRDTVFYFQYIFLTPRQRDYLDISLSKYSIIHFLLDVCKSLSTKIIVWDKQNSISDTEIILVGFQITTLKHGNG